MRLAKIVWLTIAAALWATVAVADQGRGHAVPPAHVTTHNLPTAPVPGTHGPSHVPTAHHEAEHPEAMHPEVAHRETTHHDATPHQMHRVSPTNIHTKTTAPRSPIATKIQSHPQLAARVKAMLPPDMTMDQAARGFRNQGQFIAALQASQRTGIPFRDLKTAMVRSHESLGQAVHNLRARSTPPPTPPSTTTGTPTTGTTTASTPTSGTPTTGTTTTGTSTTATTAGNPTSTNNTTPGAPSTGTIAKHGKRHQ